MLKQKRFIRHCFHCSGQSFRVPHQRPSDRPAKLIVDYRGPVLILQGLRDIQVGLADAGRLHRARPDAKLALLPDINHVLKSVSIDDLAANLAAYQDADRPLAKDVVETIAAFVKAESNVR